MQGDIWYRFENHLESAGVDEWDNPLGPPQVRVNIRKFVVEKETPKGVWLQAAFFRRFVLRGARKRYACPTLEEALESFKARKQAQLRILNTQIGRVELALYHAEQELDRERRWPTSAPVLETVCHLK